MSEWSLLLRIIHTNDNMPIFEYEFKIIHENLHTHLTMSDYKWIHLHLILRYIAYLLRYFTLHQYFAKTITISLIVIDTKPTMAKKTSKRSFFIANYGFLRHKSCIIVPISH